MFLETLLLLALGADPLGPGDHAQTVKVDGLQRSYLVHVPEKVDPQQPTPVVLVFHGGGGSAESMVRFSGLNAKADEAGFIAVYPNGTGWLPNRLLTFNGGNCCGYAMRNDIDDVAFTEAVLDDLARRVRVDPKRVYATGMSNGGIMSYYLAAKLSKRIAAIAPVGGPMGTESCDPKEPVSVMHFHGKADRNAPFAGGKGVGRSGTEFYSVEHSIQNWVQANGCQGEPRVEKIPDRSGDGTSATRTTYGGGKQGSEVVLVAIDGMGHVWPGQQPSAWVERNLGKGTKNVSANDLMWDFFQKHPKP